MKLLIEKEAAERILKYLVGRPYAETFNLVPALLNMQEGAAVAAAPEAGTEPETSPSADASEASGQA